MLAIWRQLIWKEWREQFWKMISLTAIVFACEAYFFFSDAQVGLPHLGFGLLCGVPGAFFIAMGVSAGERTAGSLDFMRSLPLERWKWAAVRLTLGALAAVVPVVVTALAMLALAAALRSAADAPRFWQASGFAALCCIGVYAWAAAAGVRQTNELRAGLAAICFFVAWLALFSFLIGFPFATRGPDRAAHLLWLISPVGFSLIPDPAYPEPIYSFTASEAFGAQLAALVAASWWFLRCYATVTAADNRSPTATKTTPSATLRPALRSPLAAIVWKEYREALPMCLAGLLIVVAILLPPTLSLNESERWEALTVAGRFLVFLGTVMALVLGVGGFAGDLEPGVWQFWRSRPGCAAGWFWLKNMTGVLVLTLAFDGALALIDLLAGGWNFLLRDELFWSGPLVHLLAYSAAAWMVCQLRQPIYAGILASGVFLSLLTLGVFPVGWPLLPWLDVSRLSTCRHLDLETSLSPLFDWLVASYLPFAAPMVAISVVFALLGWRAVRRAT